MTNGKKIFFLGPQTSYTDAAKELFKKCLNLEGYIDVPKHTITAAAGELAASAGSGALAVLPVENSIEGFVKETVDNISRIPDKNIKILAECVIPINHCLISYTDDLKNIKTVTSHPQAISQCFGYIQAAFGGNVVYKSDSSTANAVKNLSLNDKTSAVIGSRYSAEFYSKPIIAENINDEKFNQTRFILVGENPFDIKSNEYKTSITFSTENKSGALCEILKILQKYEINMSSIFSRPSKKILGEYSFYIDFDGRLTDDKSAKALFEILQHVKMFKHLGTYFLCNGRK